MDVLSFVLGLQKGKSMGGGDSADVRYVTFMNGDTKLYKKPVAVGDNCVDVVTKGLISTPTKESTASTVYAYSGWSLTNGGSASSSALSSVTANRTVYAAFVSSPRKYTVQFYDGETLLHTVSVPYGGKAEYDYKKSGYILTGWEPSNENITEDRKCYAVLEETRKLENYTWAEIAAFSEAGEGNRFELGDTKLFTFKYGTNQTTHTFNCRLVGFNHDNLADGSGKAGLTFSVISDTFWTTATMNATGTSARGYVTWADSEGFNYLNASNILWGAVSKSELGSLIKQVTKKYYKFNTQEFLETPAYLWQLSASELGFSLVHNSINVNEGDKYDFFTGGKQVGTAYPDLAREDNKIYWTRTKTSYEKFHCVSGSETLFESGQGSSGSYDRTHSVGFCI